MDNNYKLVSPANEHPNQGENETLAQQSANEHFSQPTIAPTPKVTVSLPKHAASRLRDLVQRRDIALLRLGIISVQFEDDQIIPLNLNTNVNTNQPTKQQPIDAPGPIIEDPSDDCNADSIDNLNATITTLTGLAIPTEKPDAIIGEVDKKMESNINGPDSAMLDSPSATPTAPMIIQPGNDRNSNNLAVVYVDEEDDDKDEDEVASEVEKQHSSYNIHQLSQSISEFADPIELDMYDNDNLLFPDYTLNLS